MAPPFLGGFQITRTSWIGHHALAVTFTSTYGVSYQYQLYAGRSLVGVTLRPDDRRVVGQVRPSVWPQHLTLLAVTPANRLTDYGTQLPRRPFNKVRLSFDVASWTDGRWIDVTAGTVPGGAVDATNRIIREAYRVDGSYQLVTAPLAGSGQWNFEVAGRDNKDPDGNLGTALALNQTIDAHPPDVVANSSGQRLTVSHALGTVTAAYDLP